MEGIKQINPGNDNADQKVLVGNGNEEREDSAVSTRLDGIGLRAYKFDFDSARRLMMQDQDVSLDSNEMLEGKVK